MAYDELVTRTAYHECGHALIAVLYGGRIEELSIIPDPGEDEQERFGEIRVVWPEDRFSERELANLEIKVALAGPIAEMIFAEEQYAPHFIEEWRSDWQMAIDRAGDLISRNTTVVDLLRNYAQGLVEFFERPDVWAAVAGLADHLEACETMEMEEIEEVLEAWPIEVCGS